MRLTFLDTTTTTTTTASPEPRFDITVRIMSRIVSTLQYPEHLEPVCLVSYRLDNEKNLPVGAEAENGITKKAGCETGQILKR